MIESYKGVTHSTASMSTLPQPQSAKIRGSYPQGLVGADILAISSVGLESTVSAERPVSERNPIHMSIFAAD